MSDPVQMALIASIVPALAGLTQVIISLKNGSKADLNNKKSDIILQKATEIHTLTNGNLSVVTSALAVANAKIEGLEKLMSSVVEAKKTAEKIVEEQKGSKNA